MIYVKGMCVCEGEWIPRAVKPNFVEYTILKYQIYSGLTVFPNNTKKNIFQCGHPYLAVPHQSCLQMSAFD